MQTPLIHLLFFEIIWKACSQIGVFVNQEELVNLNISWENQKISIIYLNGKFVFVFDRKLIQNATRKIELNELHVNWLEREGRKCIEKRQILSLFEHICQ